MSIPIKIGELAKKTGLSIRTLHYYHEIGLLSPSHRTEIGHRLYGEQDVIRLQQILSLRQLGFSLKEIHECLESPKFSLPQVIKLHQARLQEQIALSYTLLERLNAIATELEMTQLVAVENLMEAMETIVMSEKYFTPEQQAVLEKRFHEGEADWQDLLAKIRSEMTKGTDLNSPSVRSLAKQWLWSMKSFINGDAQIYESLMKIYQQGGAKAASWGTMDTATFEYILKAVSFLSLAEFTDLRIPTAKIFTPEAETVIRLGQDAIRQIQFDIFGTEGILLGLLAEETSLAAKLLTAAGVNFEATQQLILQTLSKTAPTEDLLEKAISETHELPFAPRAKLVVELALDRAQLLGQAYISPELLLSGILEEGGGVAIQVLKEGFGLDLVSIEEQLMSKLHSKTVS